MKTAPISAASAPHYTWGGSCDGWHLLRTPDLSVIQERMPPGASEMRHLHQRARQFFFVLEGALAIEVEGETHAVKARSGLEIPPGAAHVVANASTCDAVFLVIAQPPSHGDRVPR